MYRSLLSSSLMAVGLAASAQQYVHQVVVLSEGYFDFGTQTQVMPVTLYSYDPAQGTTQPVAVINNARFGTHVQVEGPYIYVAADSFLLKYDADTYTLLDQEIVTGIRRFDFWNDFIILSRGEVGGLPHYLEVRDKNTFDLEYIVAPADGLSHSGEDVLVVGDKAYIAVNNAFDWGNVVGYVGVLDLLNETYSQIDLGPDGTNPENIMVDGARLWTLNNTDFTGSSISRIDLANSTLDLTESIAVGSGCAASEMAEEKVFFMEYAVGQVARYDVNTENVLDTLTASTAVYGMVNDPINNQLYTTTTDFFSTGELFTMSYMGTLTSVGAVGPNPGKIDLDIRGIQAVGEVNPSVFALAPNPACEMIAVTFGTVPTGNVRVVDPSGRVVSETNINGARRFQVDISALAPGQYTVLAAGSAQRFAKL
ncbi:MAG: T9SS type A sorting domain-containing protein [Flavobacteriales bacterium]|nr:T9SS type A sorting domain-containing protein [Flavobacteriales bacterium]